MPRMADGHTSPTPPLNRREQLAGAARGIWGYLMPYGFSAILIMAIMLALFFGAGVLMTRIMQLLEG